MKYKSRSLIAMLLTMIVLAPWGVQAAVTASSVSPFMGIDGFDYPEGPLGRAWPSVASPSAPPPERPGGAVVAPSMPSVFLPSPTRSQPRPDDLGVFSSVAISAARLPATAKWSAVSSRSYAELFTDGCDRSGLPGCNTAFVSKLRAVSARVEGMAPQKLLNEVNRSVNGAMRYRSDSQNWGQADYWANPAEIAAKGAGDCEDFAIAKYWLLRSLGYGADQLQVVVLRDTRRRLYHAVLVAHVGSTAYVLDNLSSQVSSDARYASYVPIMSFVAGKSYIHGFTGKNAAMAALPTDMSLVSPGEGI
jgi:predicted transglutaminase-like cysteine proteinase